MQIMNPMENTGRPWLRIHVDALYEEIPTSGGRRNEMVEERRK